MRDTVPLIARLRHIGSRRRLMSLDDRLLADIGIGRSEIDAAVTGRRGR